MPKSTSGHQVSQVRISSVFREMTFKTSKRGGGWRGGGGHALRFAQSVRFMAGEGNGHEPRAETLVTFSVSHAARWAEGATTERSCRSKSRSKTEKYIYSSTSWGSRVVSFCSTFFFYSTTSQRETLLFLLHCSYSYFVCCRQYIRL